jgi:hypothetical protein
MKRTDKAPIDPVARRGEAKNNAHPSRSTLPSRTERGVSSPSIKRAKGLILAAAGLSLLLSIGLWFGGLRDQGLFVGIWVPSILSLGTLLLQGAKSND